MLALKACPRTKHRPAERHNQPHKYLNLNINLSELRQILCKTSSHPTTRFIKSVVLSFQRDS
ncbi:hypothetical protein FWJ33_03715 [Leptospira interrogans serovar Hardjo]|nr:hypothetical protein FWJ33_03715 [Leptospira interrogans serovar Hardjo]